MQTDSTPDPVAASRPLPSRKRRFALLVAALWVVFGSAACHKRPGVLVDELLVPVAPPRPWLPNEADLAAADLARHALAVSPRVPYGDPYAPAASTGLSESEYASNENSKNEAAVDAEIEAGVSPSVEAALQRLSKAELDEDQRHLLPLATDLRNATLDNPIAYRDASRQLRKAGKLDPRIKTRLDRTLDDDPIRLAKRRKADGWHRLWARTFNAVSEPLGNSLVSGFVLAPFQLANSLVHYVAEFSNSEPLSYTDRQALLLRKDFLAAHPDTPLTAELVEKVEKDTILLEKTLAQRRVRAAKNALEGDAPGLAWHQARQASNLLETHPDVNESMRKKAHDLAARAQKEVDALRRRKARSLESRPIPEALRTYEAAISTRILAGPIEFEEIADSLYAYEEAGGSVGRGEFLRALVQHEAGYEEDSQARLARLSTHPVERDPMSRHATQLIEDEWQNPYRAFVRLRKEGRRKELGWRLAGEWVNRPRYPNLPAPVAYLIDVPTIAMTIILAPLRAMVSTWTGGPDFQRASSLAGYRYLMRYPGGAEQRDVVEWLYLYESDRERWGRALRLADLMKDFDPTERERLVEKTAEGRLETVARLDRRDTRASVLKGVAREFPDSESAHSAGLQARAEAKDASPQHIRISRSFLEENPDVAGPRGVGLQPVLLNGDPSDGELHPEGVVLRGGRMLEVRVLADGGSDKTVPESRLRKIGPERLAQIAARLDEAVHLNSLVDLGARQGADANRDLYLERAGLGLTENADTRATAESSFVYQSLRERYGLVRGRDSVLPFDLVFRGSLGDFTLGAFPRWRAPASTPDAFLYR